MNFSLALLLIWGLVSLVFYNLLYLGLLFSSCTISAPHLIAALVCMSSENFELTANSLGGNIETHGKLILRSFSYLTVNS